MKTFLLTAVLLSCWVGVFSQCSSTSKAGGHIIYNDISTGPLAWSNLPGAENSDNNRSFSGQTVSSSTTINTSDLWAQTFLFSVPASATICGVEVHVERRQTGAVSGTSSVVDRSVKLITNMTASGTEHATTVPWSSTDIEDIYGGSSDLWGLSLTPAIVNANDFGVAISAKLQNSGTPVALSAQVDKVSVTVYYIVPLPVELIGFDASAEGPHVNLYWSTASENNSAYFLIERSTDAVYWTPVANIPGNGTSNQENNYSWTDQNAPEGVVYYNLKMVNNNSGIEQLSTTSVTVSSDKILDLRYHPSTSTVELFGMEKSSRNILSILDLSGKPVFSKEINANDTKIILKDQLPTGIYFFQLTTEGKSIVKKIMITT